MWRNQEIFAPADTAAFRRDRPIAGDRTNAEDCPPSGLLPPNPCEGHFVQGLETC